MDNRKIYFHPYNIMMVLLLAGLTMLFVGLSFAYLYTRVQSGEAPIKIPTIFLFNTLILLLSSFCLKYAKKFYLDDETQRYKLTLLLTILFTLLFMALQFYGWKELNLQNPNLAKSNMAGYVYTISVIHYGHIIGGLPFMLYFIFNAYRKMKEPVSVLVYFADPARRMELRLVTLYWNFLDLLWIYLMVFFWANYFVKI
jgi:cytochrome c oxidase subunit III